MKIFSFIFSLLLFSYSFSQTNNIQALTFASDKAFVENLGQFNERGWAEDSEIKYALKLGNVFTFFTKKGLTYRFENYKKVQAEDDDQKDSKTVRMNLSELINIQFVNANSDVKILAEKQVSHFNSYGVKNYVTNKVQNISNVKGFSKITYKNIYDKIDIEYTLHPKGGIKYNIILHPGADPSVIKMKYSTRNRNTFSESSIKLNNNGQLSINTSLGEITEHKPLTLYSNSSNVIRSSYKFENNILSFLLDNYDTSKKVIIDPWVISPAFNGGDFTREVETDNLGNVYTIGGELPMVLRKYDPLGALIWQYNTPWDTINGDWLGTLATDDAGVSFITQGTGSEIERVSTNGVMDWHRTYTPGGLSTEFWSITFNCDNTKLIVGGTGSVGLLGFRAVIYDINPANGDVNGDVTVDTGTNGFTPIEVRSISSSKNGKYIYLTHTKVGAVSQNIGTCPADVPIYELDNGNNLAYKCENFLSVNQNGGGLKAIVTNDNFFYSHQGDQISQWNVSTGALVNTVNLPGGSAGSVLGDLVVHCNGIDVDIDGNVYAGSMDRVVKFDPNLNVLSSINTTGGFTVYDVSVSSNGDVVAGGAILNNGSSTNRGARIETLNFSTNGKYILTCCDAYVCPVGPFCEADAVIALSPATLGGTWSGAGVDASGNFDPSLAGAGTHVITYSLICGNESLTIVVNPCTIIEVCEEANGDLTASAGNGTYTWYTGVVTASTVAINSEAECIACLTATPEYFLGFYTGCSINDCPISDTVWTQYATGVTTTAPLSYPIQIIDGNGVTTTFDNAGVIAPCSITPCTGVTIVVNTVSQSDPSCFNGTDGAATVDASGGTLTYAYTWMPGSLSGPIQSALSTGTFTINVVDNNGCLGSGSVTIGNPAEIIASASSTQENCGLSDGTLTGSAIGGTGSYTYSWSPAGGNIANPIGLPSGAYTLTVTDQNSCTSEAMVSITSIGGPTITLDASADLDCFGINDGSATVSATGGTGTLTYLWMPGSLTGTTQNALAPNTYTVTVTDINGCSDNVGFDILEPAEITLSTSNIVDATCGASDGEATVNASGGTGSYTYVWTPNVGSAATAVNIPAGAYTVVVSDQNGCSSSINFSVINVGGPTLTVLPTIDVSCFGFSDGEASVQATGGSMPYSYSWAPTGGNSNAASNLTAGTYVVTVTDAGSCVSAETIVVNGPDVMIITETIIDEDCGQGNGEVSLTTNGGTPTYTYLWEGTEITSSISNLSGGTYNVTVTDANGCMYTGNYTINSVGTIPLIITPVSATINAGEVIQLNVSGADTYIWTPSESLSCSDCSNPIASPNVTTTYTVIGTDASGCIGEATTTIIVEIECGDIFVPNMFSPNADLNNDFSCVYGNCIRELTYSIYNRWGERVFTADNPAECWDGFYKGEPLNSGVYVFKLNAILFDGVVVKKSGNITLVR